MAELSSLVSLQQAAGGNIQPDLAGVVGPVDFGDPAGEYRAAKSQAAVCDLSTRTHLELQGRDRQKFLHNFCTNEIRALQPGQGCEAFVTSVQGKILAHIFAFAGSDALWLDSVPGSEEALVGHLSKYLITEDVEIIRWSRDWGELYVSGTASTSVLAKLHFPAASLEPWGHAEGEVGDFPVALRRADITGTPGYLLGARRSQLPALWQALVNAGMRPAGSHAWHALRIEARFPLYGLDLSEANLAQEVGRTTQAISFTKGCYLGQEPIARIDALGHVNQELRGLQLAGQTAPLPGATVFLAGGEREIGKLTSAAAVPGEDRTVALAYLKRNYLSPGIEILVRSGGRDFPGKVV